MAGLIDMARSGRHARRGGGPVVMATMASLRRNVRGERFLPAFDPSRRDGFVKQLVGEVAAALADISLPKTALDEVASQSDFFLCDGVQCDGLVPEFPLPPEERVGFVLNCDENSKSAMNFIHCATAVTCGVEDHLQIRTVVPGLDPEAAWEGLDRIDTAINGRVEYAFRRDIGYLTANPAFAGNALAFSAFVFPIGLELQNAAEETMRDMRRLGCVFEQIGDVPETFSGLCRVSFDCGGSRGEGQCAAAFRRAMVELSERELDARRELASEGEAFLLDAFSRDLSILKNAYAISADESIAKLWTIRAGVEMGYVAGAKPDGVEAAIGGMKSASIALGSAKNQREGWQLLAELYDSDEDTRADAEDYIDTLRADYLRWMLTDTHIVE